MRVQVNNFANGQSGRFDYGFDAKGRRRYEQRDSWQADGFQYDPSDQVTSYKRDGTLNGDGTVTVPFWSGNTLLYDNNGNRTQVTGPGGGSYAPNHLNQYTSAPNVSGLGYDGKGNLLTAAGWTYTYDPQNRLLRMETAGCVVEHAYDALNRLVTRNINGVVTQYVWEGWNLIEQHRPDWTIQRCYLQGANQNEMVAAFDGNVYSNHWFWQDGRGNTSHITGDPGNLLERYTYDLNGLPRFYDEWGTERSVSAYDTRFLFAGSQFLPDINLYDMRNRFYHIGLNRFLQTDPIGFKGDRLNLYRYCGNDPVDLSDPMGLSPRIFWESARHFDSSNMEHGTFPEGKYGLQPAGTIAFAPVGLNNEGQKALLSTRAKIEHDETFDLTKDELYVAGRRAEAKTYRRLEKPEAVMGKDGVIEYTQTVTSRTTFKVPINDDHVRSEWKRVESLRFAVRELRGVAKWEAQKGFRDLEDAKSKIGKATQLQWNKYLLSSSGQFELMGGGE